MSFQYEIKGVWPSNNVQKPQEKAYAQVSFPGFLTVNNIKVIQSKDMTKYFVNWPQYFVKGAEKPYKQFLFFEDFEAFKAMNEAILQQFYAMPQAQPQANAYQQPVQPQAPAGYAQAPVQPQPQQQYVPQPNAPQGVPMAPPAQPIAQPQPQAYQQPVQQPVQQPTAAPTPNTDDDDLPF